MEFTEISVSNITGFHAHVYFDKDTREIAQQLRDFIYYNYGEVQVTELGKKNIIPNLVGPHPKQMFTILLKKNKQFSYFTKFLILNRSGLSVLIHPITGNSLEDHTTNAIWLGDKLQLNLERL